MYDDHVPQINAGMRADPETFGRGVMFAICSIRQPIDRVPALLKDIDLNGELSTSLNPYMKFEGWRFLQGHTSALWRDVCAMETRDALVRLLCVPSLGIVKSAFVLQFLGHDIACLDTHNLRKLGLDYRAFRVDGNGKAGRPPVSSKKIDRYLKLAARKGSARKFWDNWCNERAPAYAMTGEEISALHLEIIS